jgi:hypothetical protein
MLRVEGGVGGGAGSAAIDVAIGTIVAIVISIVAIVISSVISIIIPIVIPVPSPEIVSTVVGLHFRGFFFLEILTVDSTEKISGDFFEKKISAKF